MSTREWRLVGSAVMALFLCLFPAMAFAEVKFDTTSLTITTSDGKVHPFTVELAADSDQRAQGLMNRREMAIDRGMLFDFRQTRQVMMWMKDTYLPLDMLFIAKNGKVETVHENAVPLSQSIIDSGVPVSFVLELNAGTIQRLRVKPGDHIDSPAILSPATTQKP